MLRPPVARARRAPPPPPLHPLHRRPRIPTTSRPEDSKPPTRTPGVDAPSWVATSILGMAWNAASSSKTVRKARSAARGRTMAATLGTPRAVFPWRVIPPPPGSLVPPKGRVSAGSTAANGARCAGTSTPTWRGPATRIAPDRRRLRCARTPRRCARSAETVSWPCVTHGATPSPRTSAHRAKGAIRSTDRSTVRPMLLARAVHR